MKKKGVFVLAVLAATLLLGCAQMSGEDIAEKMQEKYESVEDMKGTMVITTDFQGEKQTHQIRFAMKGDKYRSEDENTTTVSNGEVMWNYDKRENEVVKMELPEVERPNFDYGELIDGLLEENDVRFLGDEEFSGRDCYLIELTPRNETYYTEQKLWVDKEFWHPLRIESNYEEFSSTIEYRNVEFNSGISDSEFEFVPPEGAKVVEKEFEMPEKLTVEEAQDRVNFTVITPEYTAGYEFSHAMVFKPGGKESVMLFYEKDEKKLTITESTAESRSIPNATKVKIGEKEGEIAEIYGSRILKIHNNGIETTISGKIAEEELIKIGESML